LIAWDLRSAKEHPALDAGLPPPGLLSAPERVFFDRLKTPRRRREWLLGRWAVKGLVRSFLHSRGEEYTAAELTVAPDPSGAPYVLAPFRGRLPLTVTLSHREDLALVALIDRPEAPLGADLEKCESRSDGFVGDFFTEKEAQAARASADRDRCVTEIWSLKESALKALRLGLTIDTRRLEASPRAAAGPGWRAATVDLSLQFVRSRGHAFVRDVGGYVATVAWLGPGPVDVPSAELRGGAVLDEPSAGYPLGEEALA
jgi:4'-phosphopantetheinyl transferase